MSSEFIGPADIARNHDQGGNPARTGGGARKGESLDVKGQQHCTTFQLLHGASNIVPQWIPPNHS